MWNTSGNKGIGEHIMIKSLETLKKVRETKLFIDFELDTTIGEEIKEELNVIQEDLEILDFLLENLNYMPSHYQDQANWNSEYISTCYIDKMWCDETKYEKLKKWLFKQKGWKEE